MEISTLTPANNIIVLHVTKFIIVISHPGIYPYSQACPQLTGPKGETVPCLSRTVFKEGEWVLTSPPSSSTCVIPSSYTPCPDTLIHLQRAFRKA